MHQLKNPSLQIYRTFCSCRRKLHYSSPKLFSNHHQEQEKTHLEEVGPMASLLKSRAVIRFRGPDTIKFLQGLLTNDIRRFISEPIGGDKTSSLYTAVLTPQGRFLYDLFLYRTFGFDEKLDEPFRLFADVDSNVLDELLDCFKKYRLRSNVDIENMTGEFSCWQRFGGNLSSKLAEEPEAASVSWGAGVDRAGISAFRGEKFGWRWYKDPRLDLLGSRGIFPSNATPPLVETDEETDEQNYLEWRIEKGVAEGSTEIPKGEAIPLEYNLAGLNAISFNKGCYVGQESVARTHHRGVIRKRLLPLKFVDKTGKEIEQKVAPGSEVVDTSSEKKVGTVTTALGCHGIGLLRLEEAFRGSDNLSIKGQDDVKIAVIRPEWWPSEWFPDHQNHSSVV